MHPSVAFTFVMASFCQSQLCTMMCATGAAADLERTTEPWEKTDFGQTVVILAAAAHLGQGGQGLLVQMLQVAIWHDDCEKQLLRMG